MTLDELQRVLPDRYRVLREIGRGGMATVYLAEDVPHGRKVAVKVLSPERAGSIDGERFKREIQIAAQLSHPNILPAYDSGSGEGIHYYVMPFVEGESLRGRLERESQLPIEDAIAIACEVCDALAYAHAQGVVHRDIKPENILLQNGHAVVADFGIARLVQEGGERLTQTGMSVGTAQYMSPEQFSGDKVDGRSDTYSVACVLYEMLVGEPPFNGPNAMAIMARATMQPVSSIRMVRATVPEAVQLAIMHALEKVPADRFAWVAEFKDALLGVEGNAALARQTRAYTAAYRAAHPAARAWQTRRTMGLAAAAAVILMIGSGGAWMALRPKAAVALPDADAKRIAVLYFDDASRDGSLRPIADGLTESLIDELDRVPTLDVKSRDAVRPFRGSAASVDSVRRLLHVGTIVRGEVESGLGGTRVTVRVLDAQSGAELKQATFPLDTAKLLTARAELTQKVAEFLRSEVGLTVQLKDSRLQASDPQAWLLVQRAGKWLKDADSLRAGRNVDAAARALGQADSALAGAAALDPAWAEPLTRRGEVAYRRAVLAGSHAALANAILDSGRVHVERALALDPRSADALEVRGELAYAHVDLRTVPEGPEWNAWLDRAEADLRAAVRLNPQQATAYETLSNLAYTRKSAPDGLLAAMNAYQADAYLLNARGILNRLFWGMYDTENFPEARRWCDEGHTRFPRDIPFVRCSLYLMATKGGTPDPALAWALRDSIVALASPATRAYEDDMARTLVGGVLGKAGLRDSADRVLVAARADRAVDPQQEIMGREIMVRLIYGDADGAITRLGDYLQVHPDHRQALATKTVWYWRDPRVQNDPRFQRLIAGAR